ncbi:MAG: PIN domain-containing protein [Candidatus Diapherotrites archaeon]|nr:PIN domain-containing protein [Candidatus Diapherotrites archaeon]
MTKKYFFDSYAIFSIAQENENYKKYVNLDIVLTKLNLFEIYYGSLRDNGVEKAEKIIKDITQFVIDFDEIDIRLAANFKLLHRKANLSMVDCIGYVVAKRLGIKFLTGDKQFENFENVEFVK